MEKKEDLDEKPPITMREYIREYKRKTYKENPQKIREKNKAYYYKQKFGSSSEEMKKYDILLPNVLRMRREIEIILEKRPELIKDILEPYLT